MFPKATLRQAQGDKQALEFDYHFALLPPI
jgi:hypothetical protein